MIDFKANRLIEKKGNYLLMKYGTYYAIDYSDRSVGVTLRMSEDRKSIESIFNNIKFINDIPTMNGFK